MIQREFKKRQTLAYRPIWNILFCKSMHIYLDEITFIPVIKGHIYNPLMKPGSLIMGLMALT